MTNSNTKQPSNKPTIYMDPATEKRFVDCVVGRFGLSGRQKAFREAIKNWVEWVEAGAPPGVKVNSHHDKSVDPLYSDPDAEICRKLAEISHAKSRAIRADAEDTRRDIERIHGQLILEQERANTTLDFSDTGNAGGSQTPGGGGADPQPPNRVVERENIPLEQQTPGGRRHRKRRGRSPKKPVSKKQD